MNIIYRIVWNKVSGQFVVASEFANGKSKSSRSTHKISGAGSAARAIAGVSAILLSVSVANVAHAGLVADGVSQSYTDRDIVTSAANDYGIQGVNAGGVIDFTGGSITTTGAAGYGAVASDNGTVNITGTQIRTSAANTHGLYSTRNGSMSADGVTVTTGNSNGLYVNTNSTLTFTNGSVTTGNSNGVYIEGNSNLTFTNGSVTSGARGVVAGGASTITIADTDITAATVGMYANVATINGERLTVLTTGRNGYGVFANAAAGSISLRDSTVTTLGDYGNGLYVTNGTLLSEQNDVSTSGIGANAVYAYGATGNISVTGGTLTTTGANAAGILASTGGRVTADNLIINSSGAGLSATGASRIDATNLIVNTGSGSSAIAAAAGATIAGTSIQGQVADAGNLVAFDGTATSANSVTLVDSALSVDGSSAIGINSINGINQLSLTNSQLSAADGSAITLQNGSTLNLTLDGSALAGVTLLDATATGTSAQISAANGSVLQGDISVDPAAAANSSLALDNSQWSGSASGLQALTLENGSQWNMADNSSLSSLTLNDSTLNFDHSNGRSTTLTVNGDFAGTGGTLVMNTVLAGDDSDTDKLRVTGNTSGATSVVVNNAGGSGAQTLNGIELITVDGNSDGEFSQKGRIVAGAYDYHLARGTGTDSKNWYLTSDVNIVPPVTPVTPVTPITPITPVTPVTPEVPDTGIVPPAVPGTDPVVRPVVIPQHQMIIRPEVGKYLANIAAANTLFNLRMHDRGGETQYVDALTGEQKTTSMWMRSVGGHQQARDSSGQLKTETNRYVMQLGGDLMTGSLNGTDSLHFGAMAGYGNARSNTDSDVTGYRSQGHITGYNVGVYGTWYQQPQQQTGAYVDSWLQYSWFSNSVNGDHLAAERYKSNGFTASLESGYSWKLGEDGAKNSYFIEPNAQLIWMGVKADDLTEANGTRVSSKGDGNVQSRVGVRASLKTAGDEGQAVFKPYLEANWINNSKTFSSTLNGVSVSSQGEKNIAELRVGVDSQLKSNVNVWGSLGQQAGSSQYRDSSAAVGVKISF